MDFRTLLSTLHDLTELDVRFDPLKHHADSNEILIGLGNAGASQTGIALNYKGTANRSVSEAVYRASDEQIDAWRVKLADVADPLKATYYVEDLSPDTCLGFLLFQVRIRGIEEVPSLHEWVSYANRWESGDVLTTGSPFESWGCLHSALAHAYFDPPMEPGLIVRGFLSCLRFDAVLLVEGSKPHKVEELSHSKEYLTAKSFLTHEYHEYRNALTHASLLQLELPIEGSRRTLLVDAFVATERVYLGALKAFVRNDRDNAWMKSGFAFMAIHRPDSAGSGNDVVITVDPSLSLHLRDLWNRLEALEDEKWAGSRPSDQPRFPDRSRANQPWYDEMGRCTLIAAPKRIDEEQLGSKLTWNEIVQAFWELYHPASHILIHPYGASGLSGERCLIHQCPPVQQDGKRFLAMKWDAASGRQSMVLTPTMKRYLAACARGSEGTSYPAIDDLPPEMSFDYLELPGGLAVIHGDGVLLLDDWSKDGLKIEDYQAEFRHLLRRSSSIKELQGEAMQEAELMKAKIDAGQALGGKDLIAINDRLAKKKMELRRMLLGTLPASTDYHVLQFRTETERRWGLQTQLEELYQALAEIESIVKGYAEARTNRLIGLISIYGFPLALFAGLFGFILQDMPSPKWWGIHWTGLALFVSMVLGSIELIRRIHKKT